MELYFDIAQVLALVSTVGSVVWYIRSLQARIEMIEAVIAGMQGDEE